MTRLNRILHTCVGMVWVGAALGCVGAALVRVDAALDHNENAVATVRSSVYSSVGGVMAAAALTAAVGWFVWKSRNGR
jgi:hypothetical protein